MKNSGTIAGQWLHILGIAGLILSVFAFTLYLLGVLPTDFLPENVGANWESSIHEYHEDVGTEADSLWMFRRFDGYMLTTAALAILASASLPVLLVLMVYWLKRRDWLYASMALAISIVLTIAIIS